VFTIAEGKFKELFPDTLIQSLDEFSLDIEGVGDISCLILDTLKLVFLF